MYAYTQNIFLVYFAFFLFLVFCSLKAPVSDVTPLQGIFFGDILGQCFCKIFIMVASVTGILNALNCIMSL